MNRTDHWQRVHTTKSGRQVSWFEETPAVSLPHLEPAGMKAGSCVLDVGGGDSPLVDILLARGLRCLAVLDVSGVALERARQRLGPLQDVPQWIEADVTGAWTVQPMDIWHDRALFHFLTAADDRDRYGQHLCDTVKTGGAAIIATFAPDGPETCSGLPVCRYSPDALARELPTGFELVESLAHLHRTPWGATQSFQYSRFARTL